MNKVQKNYRIASGLNTAFKEFCDGLAVIEERMFEALIHDALIKKKITGKDVVKMMNDTASWIKAADQKAAEQLQQVVTQQDEGKTAGVDPKLSEKGGAKLASPQSTPPAKTSRRSRDQAQG